MKFLIILLFIPLLIIACTPTVENPSPQTSTPITNIFLLPSRTPFQPDPILTPSQLPTQTLPPTPTATVTLTSSATPSPTATVDIFNIAACLPENSPILEGTVVQVIDGDTVVIQSSNNITNTVRYIGIDAPESGLALSDDSAGANSNLVLGLPVRLVKDVSETDQYQRLLRYIIVGDSFVNLELVRSGLASAQSWPPDTACAETFQAAEADARLAGMGMWAATVTPEPSAPQLVIIAVNKRAEWVDVQNQGDRDVDLSGWNLVSERGRQDCPLSGILKAGETLRIWSMTAQAAGYSCGYSSPIWNNSEPDPAVLYNPQGVEVSRK